MATISTIQSAIKDSKGLSRNNRFRIEVTGLSRMQHTLCTAMNLPGRTISTAEHTADTVTKKYAYTYIDGEVSLTFNLTNDFAGYDYWMQWLEQIIDTENYTLGYKEDYANRDLRLIMMNVKDQDVAIYTLDNAYPIGITQVDLSDASENAVAQYTVTISYDKYKYEII